MLKINKQNKQIKQNLYILFSVVLVWIFAI